MSRLHIRIRAVDWAHSVWFVSWCLSVEDFNFGVGTDAEHGGRRLEPDRLVKAGFELADWPVHQNDSRALINTDDAAKPVTIAYDIARTEPERMP